MANEVNTKLKVKEILKKIREDRGMSMQEIADVVSVPKAYIFKCEKGIIHRPYELCNMYAEKLHISKVEAKALKDAIHADLDAALRF